MGYHHEKRSALRYEIEMPIRLSRGIGKTRDFSFSGVYFITKEAFDEGDALEFLLDLKYAIPNQNVPLDCQGRVIRVEKIDNRYGVAAEINHIAYQH